MRPGPLLIGTPKPDGPDLGDGLWLNLEKSSCAPDCACKGNCRESMPLANKGPRSFAGPFLQSGELT